MMRNALGCFELTARGAAILDLRVKVWILRGDCCGNSSNDAYLTGQALQLAKKKAVALAFSYRSRRPDHLTNNSVIGSML